MIERLREDLLTDCARELAAKKAECDDLKFDNAMLTLQVNILVNRLKKAEAKNALPIIR
jgi:hypothetical protein